jgi:hypothetical protein
VDTELLFEMILKDVKEVELGMVGQTCNPSTWETERS